MTKRKTATRRQDSGASAWTERKVEIPSEPDAGQDLRCVWHTRVVVERTMSGQRYDFEPGQVQPVHKADVDMLLTLKKKQSPGCCGPGAPPVLYYFVTA